MTDEPISEYKAKPMGFAGRTLFELRHPQPTLREVATLIGDRGVAALPSAVRRADDATYQEVTCRTALNRVEAMPFEWTLNPYRGCTHGCHYCFARRYQTQLELDAGDAFSSVIFIKVNFAEVLRRELRRPSWRNATVAFGTATDPYQPIEGEYEISRRTLEVLLDAPTPVGLVTKGPLVVRGKDLLAELGRRTRCTVYVSVPTVDEAAWSVLEPGTAPPRQRLRAVTALAKAGIDVGVLMAPVVPGITSQRSKLESTLRAAADSGAKFVGANVLHLEGGTRDHFMNFVSRHYPALVDGYERLYRGKRATRGYRDDIHALVALIRARYLPERAEGLTDRTGPRSRRSTGEARAGDQRAFRWDVDAAAAALPADAARATQPI